MPTPYLSLTRFPGDPDALLAAYRSSAETMAGVGRDHGLLLHAAAPTPDGFLVLNVWADPADSEAASRDPRRLAALARLGLDPADIEREHHHLEALAVSA